ncbi:hypothetical protein HYE69_05475 [Staphylococcus sp. GSSP0090]|nr:hypothetical protein [Staphylococcus sp. GSSP0090]
MKLGKYTYDYNYIILSLPFVVVSIFVPEVFIVFVICLIYGFEKTED